MARNRGGRGGYREPKNPAGASGPGAMSQRTDGRVPQMPRTGLSYGENQAVNDQQGAAPMGAPASGGGSRGPVTSQQSLGPDGIFSPTGRPGEPLTAGVDMGPGAGAIAAPQFAEDRNRNLRAIIAEAPPELVDYLLLLADG